MDAGAWPFVGRDGEVSYLLDVLTRTKGALVVGDAGVGKSRLLAELDARATMAGWSVARAHAVEGGVPLAPFAALLPDGAPSDVLERVLSIARALAVRGDRVVLLVDDAPLLDEVSVVLVHHLVTATDIRVVLAARRGERLPDTITALVRDSDLPLIDLQPLGEDELASMVTAAIGGSVDAGTRHRLWEQTRGNPLFAREVVLDAVQRNELVESDAGWRLRATTPGRRVHDVVASRLGALDDDERVAVELLALGEPLGLALLDRLVGADVLERLERRGVIVTNRTDRREEVRLVHPIYGEVVRLGIGAAAGRARRRRLVDAIAATGARRHDDDLRLAILRCDLGEVDDVHALVDAADALEQSHQRALHGAFGGSVLSVADGCLEAAVRLGRMALDNGGRTRAAEVLMKSLGRLGRPDEVSDLLADIQRHVVDGRDVVRAARLRAYGVTAVGDVDRALALLAEALTVSSDDERAELLGARVDIRFLAGRFTEAIADGDELLESSAMTPRVAAPYALSLAQGGRAEDALRQLDPLLADTGSLDPDTLVIAVYGRLVALCALGRMHDAMQLASLLLTLADGADDVTIRAMARFACSAVHLTAGRIASAVSSATEASELFDRVDTMGVRRSVLSTGAIAHALLGEATVAAEWIAVVGAERVGQLSFEAAVPRACAWQLVAEGHHSRAVTALVETLDGLRERGAVGDEIEVLHELVRIGEAPIAVDRLAELVPISQGPLAPLAADHARGVVEGDGVRLDEVAARAAALGLLLVAADAAAHAEHAHTAAGRTASATASHRASRQWLAQCEGAITPATKAAASGVALTKRERECAELAARGMADKEIAQALGITWRTVESHLANAYSKLGAVGRRDLAALLGGEPVV